MLRVAANVTLLFDDLPMLERPAAAARAGFDGVEVLFPYDAPVAEWCTALGGRPVALINTPAGDWAAGERGFAAVPGAQDRFRRDFLMARERALALRAGRLHVMAGNARGEEARRVFVENLRWATSVAPGQALTIEPLNPQDIPGYFLDDFGMAEAILDEVGSPNLGLQFDLWHAHRITADAAGCWRRFGPRVTHVQIAGLAARGAPEDGVFDYAGFVAGISEDGYRGWVAAEYLCKEKVRGRFAWLDQVRRPD